MAGVARGSGGNGRWPASPTGGAGTTGGTNGTTGMVAGCDAAAGDAGVSSGAAAGRGAGAGSTVDDASMTSVVSSAGA